MSAEQTRLDAAIAALERIAALEVEVDHPNWGHPGLSKAFRAAKAIARAALGKTSFARTLEVGDRVRVRGHDAGAGVIRRVNTDDVERPSYEVSFDDWGRRWCSAVELESPTEFELAALKAEYEAAKKHASDNDDWWWYEPHLADPADAYIQALEANNARRIAVMTPDELDAAAKRQVYEAAQARFDRWRRDNPDASWQNYAAMMGHIVDAGNAYIAALTADNARLRAGGGEMPM